jgi:putative SOS response-associated peptidase YedK
LGHRNLPNELMAMIHNRMPVIPPVNARDRWLEASEDEFRSLLVPLPAGRIFTQRFGLRSTV